METKKYLSAMKTMVEMEKMDFRRSCSIIIQRQGQSSMQHLSYRGSADIWRRMDTRVIIICRTSNAALAGHM